MSLLSVRSAAVLTFPKGVRALRCPFRQRYRLAQFGQGFMRVALVTDVPIVPVAVIGAAEETPRVANTRWLARLLRTPVAPLSPTLVVPLPVKYQLLFGRPMRFAAPRTVPQRVARYAEQVRTALAELIQQGPARRRHVFW